MLDAGTVAGLQAMRVRALGRGAYARVGSRLWAWLGGLPGAGFWKATVTFGYY